MARRWRGRPWARARWRCRAARRCFGRGLRHLRRCVGKPRRRFGGTCGRKDAGPNAHPALDRRRTPCRARDFPWPFARDRHGNERGLRRSRVEGLGADCEPCDARDGDAAALGGHLLAGGAGTACLSAVAPHQRKVGKLGVPGRQLGIDVLDEGAERLARWLRPGAVDRAVVAADARELALEFAHQGRSRGRHVRSRLRRQRRLSRDDAAGGSVTTALMAGGGETDFDRCSRAWDPARRRGWGLSCPRAAQARPARCRTR